MSTSPITVTQLALEDFAGSGFELVRAVRLAEPAIDIEQLVVRKTAFGIPCGPTLGEVGRPAAQARLDRSDILHFKGDFVHEDWFAGLRLPAGARRVYTVGGSFFRRGLHPAVSLGREPLERYRADYLSALTPELCYTPDWHWTPHAWSDFCYGWRRDERFRVLHVPSVGAKKGTEIVTEALRRCLKRRRDVDFVTVTAVPHAHAMALKQDAHLYIDQMLLPVYGRAAVEAMACGIPVINWLEDHYDDIPVLAPRRRTAAALADLIESVLDWDVLEALSRRVFAYARRRHGAMGRHWAAVYRDLAAGRAPRPGAGGRRAGGSEPAVALHESV